MLRLIYLYWFAGDVRLLDVKDLDLKRGALKKVPRLDFALACLRHRGRVEHGGEIQKLLWERKTAGGTVRRLLLDRRTLDCLLEWLTIRGKGPGPLFTRLDPAGRPRRGKPHQGLSRKTIHQITEEVCRRAGWEPMAPGLLRMEAMYRAAGFYSFREGVYLASVFGDVGLKWAREHYKYTDILSEIKFFD